MFSGRNGLGLDSWEIDDDYERKERDRKLKLKLKLRGKD